MDKTLYLVRHCQATGKEPHAELTEEGKGQAKQLMRFFEKRKINRIISSPFTRAIQSIEPTAASQGLLVEMDDRLAEHRLLSENAGDWLKRLKESVCEMDVKLAEGTSSKKVIKEGLGVIESAADGSVLSTHGNIVGLLLVQMHGIYGLKEWGGLSYPDVYEVKVQKSVYSARKILCDNWQTKVKWI